MAKPQVLITTQEQTQEPRRRPPVRHEAREQLLAALPVTERRLQLAGVSTV
jgi:hypothetical protein